MVIYQQEVQQILLFVQYSRERPLLLQQKDHPMFLNNFLSASTLKKCENRDHIIIVMYLGALTIIQLMPHLHLRKKKYQVIALLLFILRIIFTEVWSIYLDIVVNLFHTMWIIHFQGVALRNGNFIQQRFKIAQNVETTPMLQCGIFSR